MAMDKNKTAVNDYNSGKKESFNFLFGVIIKLSNRMADPSIVRKVLSKLKPNYCLIALSNTEEVHWKFILEKYPIFKLLDGWVVSYEQGVQKPDPAIYRVVTNQFCNGMSPFFYTDDIPEYIEAAQKLGWQAAVFIDAAQFEKNIKRLATNY